MAKSASANANSVIQYDNLRFLSIEGEIHSVKITITNFKQNTGNRPFDIIIARESSSPYCPVHSMLRYTNIRGSQPGPLFCHADGRPISVCEFNTVLKQCLNFCGLDTSHSKSHSFRIGAACHAAENGFSEAHIRALGRWKSDAFKLYIRSSTLTAN